MTDAEIVERLGRLERENRRLKRFTAGGLALVVLFSGYAALHSRTQVPGERVMTHELDVMDSSGKVRIKMDVQCLSANNCWPEINLLNKGGKQRTGIGAGTLNISGDKGEVELLDNVLQFSNDFKQAVPGVTARLEGDSERGGALWLFGRDSAYAFVNSNPPTIEVQDSKGFMMDLGTADLATVRTGETSRTSAASIVMFRNDKKGQVIWRAP